MFDILFVRRQGNSKDNERYDEQDVAYIFYTELVPKTIEGNPHGIKQMSH